MAEVKVSEATPLQLNWLVAKINGLDVYIPPWAEQPWIQERDKEARSNLNWTGDWAQGGPIIEREMRNHGFDVWRTEDMKECAASYTRGVPSEYVFGPTPLIAAMRCYVAFKMGDEVETPEGLNHGA